MTMQRNVFEGAPIGMDMGDRFEDRMRRIAISYRSEARLRGNDDSPWLTLVVDTGREIAVKNLLDESDIEALVPMRMGPELRRRGRVLPATLTPVMVGYVLVRCLVRDKALLGLKSFDHVRDVLGGCVTPRLTKPEEVNRFKEKAEAGGYDWGRPTVIFKRGEKVVIAEGPFAGLRSEIVTCRDDGKGDAVVEVEIFGVMRPVLVPLAILEKV